MTLPMNNVYLWLSIIGAIGFLVSCVTGIIQAVASWPAIPAPYRKWLYLTMVVCLLIAVAFGRATYLTSLPSSITATPTPVSGSLSSTPSSIITPTPISSSPPSPTGSWHIQRTGPCQWTVWLQVEHLQPGSLIQLYDRNYSAFDCTTGPRPVASWPEPQPAGVAGPEGVWMVGKIHNDYGSYHYEVTDDVGHVVHLDITYDRNGRLVLGSVAQWNRKVF